MLSVGRKQTLLFSYLIKYPFMTLYGECFYPGKYHTIAAFISRHCRAGSGNRGYASPRDIAATESRVSCVSIMLRRSRSTIRMNHFARRKPGSWGAVFTVHSITGMCSEVRSGLSSWSSLLTGICPALCPNKNTESRQRCSIGGDKNWAWFNLVLTSSVAAN